MEKIRLVHSVALSHELIFRFEKKIRLEFGSDALTWSVQSPFPQSTHNSERAREDVGELLNFPPRAFCYAARIEKSFRHLRYQQSTLRADSILKFVHNELYILHEVESLFLFLIKKHIYLSSISV